MNHDPSRSADAAAEPRLAGERIVALDALRGFALLGILLVNIKSFSGIDALGVASDEAIVTDLVRFLARGKFLSLFAMLFGVGFVLQTTRLRDRGMGLFPIWWRRVGLLFVLGLLHTLLDPAEVLAVYALCAVLMLPFQRLTGRTVIVLSLLIMGLPHLHTAIVTPVYVAEPVSQSASTADAGLGRAVLAREPTSPEPSTIATTLEDAPAEAQDEETPSWDPYLGNLAVRLHSGGSFTDVVEYNFEFTRRRWTASWLGYLWMTVPLPMMLVGMLVGRSGILTRLSDEKPRLKTMLWLGSSVGIVMGLLVSPLIDLAARSGWNPWVALPANWLFSLSGLLMASGYGAGLLLLLQGRSGRALEVVLAPVGRMALTNYVMQTVVCITLFFGFGLGLYGRVGAIEAVLIAVGIFGIQVVCSRLWLRAFRFGPLEWLWRMATYRRRLELRA